MFNFLSPKTMHKQLTLLATMALALVACNKSQTIITETPGEISFKAVTSVATKADIIPNNLLPSDAWLIHASANAGTVEYFKDKTFKAGEATPTAETDYKNWSGSAFVPVYWPVGGSKLDFVAYAAKDNSTNVTPTWGSPAANTLTLDTWNTYVDQQDIVWAVANGETRATNTSLKFNHAQAQIIFKVQCEQSADIYKVNSITINGLKTTGSFTVDNSKVTPEASWTLNAGVPTTVKNISALTAVTTTMAAIGDALLVPQQDVCSFTINYKSGDVDNFTYTVNPERKVWEMGKTYIYELKFSAQEIVFRESVELWAEQSAELSTL